MDLRLKRLIELIVPMDEDCVEYRIVVSVLLRRCIDEDEAMTEVNDDGGCWSMMFHERPAFSGRVRKIFQQSEGNDHGKAVATPFAGRGFFVEVEHYNNDIRFAFLKHRICFYASISFDG